MFDLDEKLQCERFGTNLVKHMEGKGEMNPLNTNANKIKHCVTYILTIPCLAGSPVDFTFEYIQREGLREPIIFNTPDGLGLE